MKRLLGAWCLVASINVVCAEQTFRPPAAISSASVIPDGRVYEITLGREHVGAPPLVVEFDSPGNSSTAVVVALEAPSGIVGRVRGARLEHANGGELRIIDNSWEQYSIIGSQGRRYGGFLISGTVGGTTEFVYHLHKDACIPQRQSLYRAQLTLDLNSVDRALFEAGFTIRVAIREVPFSGSRIASVKPASDGKYRGEPILLMGTVSYGGEYVTITRRRAGRVVSRRRIPVVKYVSYKGRALSLARLRGVLTGGRATFDLSNGGYVYGVCFRLARTRQVVNGYPL